MSEQDGRQATTIQRPTTNDPEAWKAYWKANGLFCNSTQLLSMVKR